MLPAAIHLYRKAYAGIPRPIWWLSLVILVNRAGTMVIPFLTVYLTGNGYTLREAGLVMATFGLGALLGGYIGGQLTDRFGSFSVQLVSLFFNGVFFIILGQMHSLWSIAACVFALSTIGESFRPANAAAIAAYSEDSNRTRSYSLNRLAINLGWSVGPAVGGVLASINYGLLFWVDGGTCIVAAALLYRFLRVPGQAKTKRSQEPEAGAPVSAYRDTTFLTAMFFLMIIGFCFFQLFSIIPVYYKEAVHLSEFAIGWVLASNGLVIALVEMVLIYHLENRRAAIVYMTTGTVLTGLSFLALSAGALPVFVLVSMLFVTVGEMLLFPFTNQFWVSRTTPANRGRYAALYTMSFAVAHILAPLVGSALALRWGFAALFRIDFLLCVLAAFGFLWMRKKM
jgi:predicted MFS family arabinose efflux permease